MSNLMLADHLFPAVMQRKQVNTIRFRHREIRKGPALFVATNETRQPLVIDITAVRHCTFSELTVQDLQNQGFDTTPESRAEDLAVYLSEMQKFYPEMDMNSPVTVIDFNFLREQLEF